MDEWVTRRLAKSYWRDISKILVRQNSKDRLISEVDLTNFSVGWLVTIGSVINAPIGLSNHGNHCLHIEEILILEFFPDQTRLTILHGDILTQTLLPNGLQIWVSIGIMQSLDLPYDSPDVLLIVLYDLLIRELTLFSSCFLNPLCYRVEIFTKKCSLTHLINHFLSLLLTHRFHHVSQVGIIVMN